MEEEDVGEQHGVSAHEKKRTFPGKGQLSASSRLGDTTHRATDRKLPISQKADHEAGLSGKCALAVIESSP